MNKVIAIVGMPGSGKSLASDYLEKRGYKKVYFGGVTMQKLKEAGLEINPENEKMMREKLRAELGMGAYAKILLPSIREYSLTNNVVIDGLYSWDEYKILSDGLGNNLKAIAIIVDKEIRYERLSHREIRPLNKEESINRDLSEIENIDKSPPIVYADFYLYNNGTIENYYKTLNEIINKIERGENI